MNGSEWFVVGEIVATWGNKGEVKVIAHTEFPERFLNMESVRLFKGDCPAPSAVYELEGCRFQGDNPILKLKNVDSITKAEELRTMLIKVSRAELMPLPPGRHYVFDLIGLECKTVQGEVLGQISEVLQTGANDVYVLRPRPGVTKLREILIPVISEVVLEIDPQGGFVLVDLLEGLLD